KAPIVGDPVYGLRGIVPHRAMTQTLIDALGGFKRQALHAIKLGLIHPETQEPMHWQIELPADMKAMLEAMRAEDIPESDEELEFDFMDDDLEDGEFEE